MNTIHQLTEPVIAKIAAGEVIERPSYAVKELVENALDAKATNITIHLIDAGLTVIRVTDNGIGMSMEDIKASWKPHTTSKISDEEDLHRINSFGFRGEALSSLAAVSILTIESRQKNESTGYRIVIDHGTATNPSVVGMPQGTVITAERLFAHVPARKKFLKSEKTELRQSIDIINRYALAHPSVQFTLTHDKKTLLYYPETAHRVERIEQVLGLETTSLFIPFTKAETYIAIEGYIAKPQLTARSPQKQHVFINSRAVSDPLIGTAVKDSYGTMLESATYPVFVLFVTIPYELVDINVHPRKEEVRFSDGAYVFQTVKQMVTEVLADHNLTFQNLSWKRAGAGLTRSVAGTLLTETVLKQEAHIVGHPAFLQFKNLYIVAATDNGLFLIDQHAAHERILFEKLKYEFLKRKGNPATYRLPIPKKLTLSVSEKTLLAEHQQRLRDLGFHMSNQKVTHVPSLFRDRDINLLIAGILEDLSRTGTIKSIDTGSEEMLSFLACRAAVKAGDSLTEEQMKQIVTELESCPNNATCPHGRPTRIELSIGELNTMFHRS